MQRSDAMALAARLDQGRAKPACTLSLSLGTNNSVG